MASTAAEAGQSEQKEAAHLTLTTQEAVLLTTELKNYLKDNLIEFSQEEILSIAAHHGNIALAAKALAAGAKIDGTPALLRLSPPLHRAIRAGQFDMVKFLLQNKADPNIKHSPLPTLLTPLMDASTSEALAPVNIATNKLIILVLLRAGAKINCYINDSCLFPSMYMLLQYQIEHISRTHHLAAAGAEVAAAPTTSDCIELLDLLTEQHPNALAITRSYFIRNIDSRINEDSGESIEDLIATLQLKHEEFFQTLGLTASSAVYTRLRAKMDQDLQRDILYIRKRSVEKQLRIETLGLNRTTGLNILNDLRRQKELRQHQMHSVGELCAKKTALIPVAKKIVNYLIPDVHLNSRWLFIHGFKLHKARLAEKLQTAHLAQQRELDASRVKARSAPAPHQ